MNFGFYKKNLQSYLVYRNIERHSVISTKQMNSKRKVTFIPVFNKN